MQDDHRGVTWWLGHTSIWQFQSVPALLGPSNYEHQWILHHLRVSSSKLPLFASVVFLHLMPFERNLGKRFAHHGDNQDANYLVYNKVQQYVAMMATVESHISS